MSAAPAPTFVRVEVVDELWLVWDPSRGYWTLQPPPRQPGLSEAAGAGVRVMPKGTIVTLMWPEP